MDKSLKRRELILNGNLWHAILLLAVPVAINSFIRAMYNLVDTFFVASIGSMEVAAITFVGPINSLVMNISVGLAVGGTNLVAREIGREDYEKAKSNAIQILAIALGFGIIIALFSFIFSKQILLAASATESIMGSANIYFRLTVLSSPFVFINSAYIAIRSADGDTLKTMRVNMVAMGIKMILTYVLIFHFNMGIISLAISTIVGTMFVTLFAIYDMFIRETMLRLSLSDLKFIRGFLIGLLIISVPIVIEKSSISFSFIILNKYVIGYGEKVLAGYGITNRVNSMFFATVTGFASGLSPIISQNLGANQDQRAREAIKKTYFMALAIAIVVISFVLPFKAQIASVFAKGDQEVLYHTVNAMSVYSITVIPWAIFQVTNGVFQGTGHTRYNMVISLMRIYAFRIPIVMILTYFTAVQEYSIWYSMLFSNILTALLALLVYYRHRNDLHLVGE